MSIDYRDFSEFPPAEAPRAALTANPIFITMRPTSMMFSRATNVALSKASRVKVFFNEAEKQFLLAPAEEGEAAWTFLKEGRTKGAYVIWQNKDLLEKVRGMLPKDKKDNVRINGKKMESEDGTYVLFDCKDLGELRKFNRKK